MPQSLWDSLALMLWISRIGPYVALAVLFFMVVTPLILDVEKIKQLGKNGRTEVAIATGVLLPFTLVGAYVDKGENTISPHQSWSGLQSLGQSLVPTSTVATCWALTVATTGLALYHLWYRHMQRAKLYGFVAIACLALSTRAMQLHSMQDRWAMANLLAGVTSTACVALLASFLNKEWQEIKPVKP